VLFFLVLILVLIFGAGELIELLCVVVFGVEPPPAPAAPLVAGVVWALAIAAVVDMARMSAAA
jgi:hypothetical protein